MCGILLIILNYFIFAHPVLHSFKTDEAGWKESDFQEDCETLFTIQVCSHKNTKNGGWQYHDKNSVVSTSIYYISQWAIL